MLSVQCQDGQTGESMPDSQVTTRMHRRAWRDPQQEDQQDATEGKDIADYNLDVDFEGSEHEVEQSAQEQKAVDPDAEYAEIEIPQDGTHCQRIVPWEQYMGILQIHRAQETKLWPQSSRICRSSLDLAPKQASCSLESRD